MVIMPVREHNQGYFPTWLGGNDVEVSLIIWTRIDHDGSAIFIAFNEPCICTFQRCVAGGITQHSTGVLRTRAQLSVCRMLRMCQPNVLLGEGHDELALDW